MSEYYLYQDKKNSQYSKTPTPPNKENTKIYKIAMTGIYYLIYIEFKKNSLIRYVLNKAQSKVPITMKCVR